MIEPTFCSGLADLASRYRGFIVDQWGVLHDGARPYAHAIDCLAQLRAAGKRVVLLSNSGKRTAINRARLAEVGIDGFMYDAIVTSGEATWQALADRTEPFFRALGRRCVLWSRYGDRSVVGGLALEVVERIEDAEFLLLGGVDDDARLEDFSAYLELRPNVGCPWCAPTRTSWRCSPTAARHGPRRRGPPLRAVRRQGRLRRQAAPPDLPGLPPGARPSAARRGADGRQFHGARRRGRGRHGATPGFSIESAAPAAIAPRWSSWRANTACSPVGSCRAFAGRRTDQNTDRSVDTRRARARSVPSG